MEAIGYCQKNGVKGPEIDLSVKFPGLSLEELQKKLDQSWHFRCDDRIWYPVQHLDMLTMHYRMDPAVKRKARLIVNFYACGFNLAGDPPCWVQCKIQSWTLEDFETFYRYSDENNTAFPWELFNRSMKELIQMGKEISHSHAINS